jgi:hypothetical protein
VDGPGHHSLAGPGFAQEKNRRILRGHLFDPEKYIRDGIALTNDLGACMPKSPV